jgi:hypothetical protein
MKTTKEFIQERKQACEKLEAINSRLTGCSLMLDHITSGREKVLSIGIYDLESSIHRPRYVLEPSNEDTVEVRQYLWPCVVDALKCEIIELHRQEQKIIKQYFTPTGGAD